MHGEYNYQIQAVTENKFPITNNLIALRSRRNTAAALRNFVVRLVMRFAGYEFSVTTHGRYKMQCLQFSMFFLFRLFIK